VDDELGTARRFEAAIQDAVARERIDLSWGVALRSPDLPGVDDANLARVEPRFEEPSAGEIVAELDRVRGDLWFDKLLVDDDDAAQRLRPGLEAAGFDSTALVVMAYRGHDGEPQPNDAREVTQEEAHATRVAINTEELPPQHAEYAPHISHLQERIAEEIPTHVFAAPAAGEIGALCSLYTVAGVSQLEEVSTLRTRRGEGLGRAAVRAALHAALEMAPELVFIVAGDGDWVKDWYWREGFEPIGRTWRFTRTTG
jgi:ribosomal protein S18 acetylase RimI-like enzyme